MNTDNNLRKLADEAVTRAILQTRYVVGFYFSADRKRLVLIEKQKPIWQRGLLNGIGGKVELGESIEAAMVREFQEETGVTTGEKDWKHFCSMSGDNDGGEGRFRVDYFFAAGDLAMVRTMETEAVVIARVADIRIEPRRMIENLPWLVALALDSMKDNRPSFAEVTYPTYHG